MPTSTQAATGFSFVVLSDLHYRDERCSGWLEAVVANLRALRPRPAFVLLNGDLSDTGTRAQLGAVKEIVRTLPMPVHSTIGNHDYISSKSRVEYDRLFGRETNFRFRCDDWDFVALDTTDGPGVYRTWITGQTLGWMDDNLPRISTDRPLVVFSHFPLSQNWLRPLNARDVNLRLQSRNVAGVFCGHWHGLSERSERAMPVSIGRCCSWWRGNHDGTNLKGYFLCHASPRGLSHEFVTVEPPRGLSAAV
jgi:calcineurin-like phosphoesterase family protein